MRRAEADLPSLRRRGRGASFGTVSAAVRPIVPAGPGHSAASAGSSPAARDGGPPIDFCTPANPYFPTAAMFGQLGTDLEMLLKRDPTRSPDMTAKLADALGLHPGTVAVANGSTELLTWIDALYIRESVAIPIPTSGRWTQRPMATGKRVDMYPLQEADGFALDLAGYLQFIRFRGSRVAVLCNPNSPDGGCLPRHELLHFVDSLADLDLIVVDESAVDFVDAEPYPSIAGDAVIRPNVVVLASLGHSLGLPGLRLGHLVANPVLAGALARVLPEWNVNAVAEALVWLVNQHGAEYRQSLRTLIHDRYRMAGSLSRVPGMKVLPSQGNSILVKLPASWSASRFREYLLAQYHIRVFGSGHTLGLASQFLRLVVRPDAEVERLIEAMQAYGRQSAGEAPPQPAPDLAMVQGL